MHQTIAQRIANKITSEQTKKLASGDCLMHKARPSLGLGFGLVRSRPARCALRVRVPPNEAILVWKTSDHCEDSSVRKEQMPDTHRVAGSNPAPALRFSLLS